jgi:DNA (cytosine-5)-methyltransferase 1
VFEQHNITGLFAGIGGFEHGLHLGGHRTTLFCECDPEAVSVLRKRFPDIKVLLDVRRRAELIASIDAASDLLSAGFPCTDLSQAGRTRGLDGDQSGLIRDTLGLLSERPFKHGLLENVPNWRTLHGGRHLTEVLEQLERLGYVWAYRVVDARSFGLPQRRARLIVYFAREGDPREVLFHGNYIPSEGEWPIDQKAHGFYWTEGNTGLGWGENCVPTIKGSSGLSIPSAPAVILRDGTVVTPDIRDAERLQGFEAGWTDLSFRDELVGGGKFNQRRRWWLVGNAVNVRLSRWLGQRLADRIQYLGPAGKQIDAGDKLPAAAWFDGKKRWSTELTSWPMARPQEDLETFLIHERHPLSLRAASGFLSRLEASSLREKPGFLPALRRYVGGLQARGEPAPSAKTTQQREERPANHAKANLRASSAPKAKDPKVRNYSS